MVSCWLFRWLVMVWQIHLCVPALPGAQLYHSKLNKSLSCFQGKFPLSWHHDILNPLQVDLLTLILRFRISPPSFTFSLGFLFSARNWLKVLFRNMCAASICISRTLAASSWCRWVVMMLEANLSVFPPVWWDQMTHLSPQAIQKTYTDTHSLFLLCLVSVFFSSVRCPCMGSCHTHVSLCVCTIIIYCFMCVCVCVCVCAMLRLPLLHSHTFELWLLILWPSNVLALTLAHVTPEVLPNHLVKLYLPFHYAALSWIVCVCTMRCATVHDLTFIANHWVTCVSVIRKKELF